MNNEFRPELFPSTRWSVVERAKGNDRMASKAALDMLCATYWKPIRNYIRHLGQAEQDAEDLVQDFFQQQMVRRNLFLEVRKEKGSLRRYVSVAVLRLVIDTNKKKRRLKRGGDKVIVSLETISEQSEGLFETSSAPDQYFDRQWAAALMERTLTELESDYAAEGKEELFRELKPYLGKDKSEAPQSQAALRLGKSVEALRTDLWRMRKRFGEVYRMNVADTVPSHSREEVEAEIAHLANLFS